MKRILVTGATGFLGQHLTQRLRHSGADVYGISSDTDLTDWRQVDELFREQRPDLVYHLAAEVGGIGANRAKPGRFWFANLMMGAHVLEACRIHDVGKLVQVGTVCSYPKHAPAPFPEESLWDGYPEKTNAPYGIAKKTLLVGAQAYHDQYGLNAITLLSANLYGPYDNFDLDTSHVIPALIRKMCAGDKTVTIWGNGSPTREFLYVDDCVDGLLLAAESYDDPEPVNLGTGVETSIGELVQLIADVTGYAGGFVFDSSMPNGQPRRVLDTSRAAAFGFKAKTRLLSGLVRTVEWWQAQAISADVKRCEDFGE